MEFKYNQAGRGPSCLSAVNGTSIADDCSMCHRPKSVYAYLGLAMALCISAKAFAVNQRHLNERAIAKSRQGSRLKKNTSRQSHRRTLISRNTEKHRLVGIRQLKPSQPKLGLDSAVARAQELSAEAKQAGITIETLVKNRARNFVIPAIISPKGEFYILDAQHGIAATLMALEDKPLFNPKIRIEILKDYSSQALSKRRSSYFVVDFVSRYLKKNATTKITFSEAKKYLDELPADFSKMKNDPMRSLVGAALRRYGVNPGLLANFVEFDIGRMLESDGTAPMELSYNEDNIEIVAQRIFTNPGIHDFLKKASREEGTRIESIKLINKAISKALLMSREP